MWSSEREGRRRRAAPRPPRRALCAGPAALRAPRAGVGAGRTVAGALSPGRRAGEVRGRAPGTAWWVGEGVRARLRLGARSRHYAGRHFLSGPREWRGGGGGWGGFVFVLLCRWFVCSFALAFCARTAGLLAGTAAGGAPRVVRGLRRCPGVEQPHGRCGLLGFFCCGCFCFDPIKPSTPQN